MGAITTIGTAWKRRRAAEEAVARELAIKNQLNKADLDAAETKRVADAHAAATERAAKEASESRILQEQQDANTRRLAEEEAARRQAIADQETTNARALARQRQEAIDAAERQRLDKDADARREIQTAAQKKANEDAAKAAEAAAAQAKIQAATDARAAAAQQRYQNYKVGKDGKLSADSYKTEIAARMEHINFATVKTPEEMAIIHRELADFMRKTEKLVPSKKLLRDINDPFEIEKRIRSGGIITENEFASMTNMHQIKRAQTIEGKFVSDFALREEMASKATTPILGFSWKNPLTYITAFKNLITGSRSVKSGLESTPKVRGIGLTPQQIVGGAIVASVGITSVTSGVGSFVDGLREDRENRLKTGEWTLTFREQVAHALTDAKYLPLGRPDFKVTPMGPDGKTAGAEIDVSASGHSDWLFNYYQKNPKAMESMEQANEKGMLQTDLAGYWLRAQNAKIGQTDQKLAVGQQGVKADQIAGNKAQKDREAQLQKADTEAKKQALDAMGYVRPVSPAPATP